MSKQDFKKLLEQNKRGIDALETSVSLYQNFLQEANVGDIYTQKDVDEIAKRAKQDKEYLDFKYAERDWLTNVLSKFD